MIVYTSKSEKKEVESFVRQAVEKNADSEKRKENATDAIFCKEQGDPKKAFEAAPDGYGSCFENIGFEKEFVIPAEWLKDDHYINYEESGNIQRRAEYMIASYYRFCRRTLETALAGATAPQTRYKGFVIDLRTPDGEPLFSKNHSYGETGRQSNLFEGNFLGDEKKTNESLDFLASKLFEMKDEHGEPLRYFADTIIIPVNRVSVLNKIIKAVTAQENPRWKVVTLSSWFSDDDRFMVMSSKANFELCGNMFWNRIPLLVTSWVDSYTGNYIWNARSRIAVSFNTYKHILIAIDPQSAEDPI